ncbi:MAG: methyl-accepting chemotaxis protein [bacterium]
MEWFNNLKVNNKILTGYGLAILIMCLIGYEGITSLNLSEKEDKLLYEKNTVALGILNEISTSFQRQRTNILEVLHSSGDITLRDDQLKRIEDRDTDIENHIPQYKTTYINETDVQMFEEWITSYRTFKMQREKVIQLVKQNNVDKALLLYRNEMENIRKNTQTLFDKLNKMNLNEAQRRSELNASETESAIVLMVILIISGIVIAVVLGTFISRKISRPINLLAVAANKFSNGEKNIEIDVSSTDEVGALAKAFNTMVDKISEQLQYLDNLPTPVMIINKEFNIQYMNKSGAAILGKNQQEIINKKCYDCLNTEDCKTEKCACAQAINYDKTKTEETNANIRGQKIPIMYSGSPIKDKKGNIIGALEYVVDISEIKNLQNYLNRKTSELLTEMGKFSTGDLTVSVNTEKDDDIGKLFGGFNLSVQKIRELLTEVTSAIEATARAGSEISSSTEELAAGSQEQSSQAGEIAGAINQMSAAILQTSKHASSAAENAKNAGAIALEGGKVVESTILGMNRIETVVNEAAKTIEELGKSSIEIGEIIQVIDGIADQTNLLALNAAIEAARAGEQGRGFAVVADEVRKLAERTTSATKEIANKIKKIQTDTGGVIISINEGTKEVKVGKELAVKAGDSLRQIMGAVNQVIDVADQVAAASEEQSSTSEQISGNIELINNVIQEAASGTQQIAHSVEDLNQLTENLQILISKFQLYDTNNNRGLMLPNKIKKNMLRS